MFFTAGDILADSNKLKPRFLAPQIVLQAIGRAKNTFNHMSINFCGGSIWMPQQLLYGLYVIAWLQQVSSKTVV